MTAPLVIASSDDRPAWLAARRQGVTATDVSKYGGAKTLRRLLADKRGELRDFRTKAMAHGAEREAKIADWVERKSRAGAFGSGALVASHSLFAHPDDHRFLATPDGIAEDFEFFAELVEIKTTNHPWSTIPRAYLRQVWWQQYVLGADRTLVVWEQHEDGIPVDLEPRWQWVKRDQQEIDDLRVKALELLGYMAGEPLPDPVADELIAEYLERKAAVEAATAELKVVEARVRDWIGDRDEVKVLGTVGDLSFSTVTSTRLDSTQLKKDHPDLWDGYSKESTSTRLSISPLKDDVDEKTKEAA